MHREPCVYLLARSARGTLYVGSTSNLIQRLHQHRQETFRGHSARYGIKRLVWFERHETMDTAIRREKQIKRWVRDWKYELVNAANPIELTGAWVYLGSILDPRSRTWIRCRRWRRRSRPRASCG